MPLAEAARPQPQASRGTAKVKSPHGDEETFATPAVHSPLLSSPASSQQLSRRQNGDSSSDAEQESGISIRSGKLTQRDTARKSRQIPALAHDIELRNRIIFMEQQQKVELHSTHS